MKTYRAVKAEIAKLEKKAEELRRQELKTIIAQVRQVIVDYGLTPADLGLGATRGVPGRRRAAPTRRAATVGVARYRDPKSGQTWTGKGRPPAWIAAAKNRDAFLIDAPAAPKKAGAAKPAAKKPAAKKGAARSKPASRAKKGRAASRSGAVEIESGVAVQ